ncbi:MAG: isoprenylcysteine carboxylmethyltransferase family protein [Candidatus Nanoarchaeia archaeon]|nr:isoprenylcysteine carboxylmethyltransferase family protein [Candidatus Nanoarchaeia archaeon]
MKISRETKIQVATGAVMLFFIILTLKAELNLFYIIPGFFIFSGIFLWFYTFFYMKSSWSLENVPKDKLITKGPFRIARHPLYLGVLITFTAGSFFSDNYYVFVLLGLLYAITIIRARKEDNHLKSKFKDSWGVYAKKTGLLFPKRF